ncbi:hypothetical protein [Streptomyces sp. cg40]|uniref:hypothetical protein n=1 Tax=Streptomyces sp. cg40 TaxID=3419764 RepID=UPI003D03F5F2
MEDYIEQTISRIREGLTFQRWLDTLPDDQLHTFADREDKRTDRAVTTLALHFAGAELEKNSLDFDAAHHHCQSMMIALACESNVRRGWMVRIGDARVSDSNATYKMTGLGSRRLKDMQNNDGQDSADKQ